MTQSEDENIAKAFEKTLNRHGYGFQFAVLRRIADLFLGKQSMWELEVSEYPAEVQGRSTRIDFILKRKSRVPFVDGARYPFFLLAECKRANPATSNWCFIKAPFTFRNPSEQIFFEQAELDDANRMTSSAMTKLSNQTIYHLGLEVKTSIKGEAVGSTRGEIEYAATQVLRGLNGIVNYLPSNLSLFLGVKKVFLMPVIFTTARLWVTTADLSNAELESGNVDLTSAGSQNVDWLLYQYNTSPGLKHSHSSGEQRDSLSRVLQSEFVRTIPIVSPNGIKSFLHWAGNIEFFD